MEKDKELYKLATETVDKGRYSANPDGNYTREQMIDAIYEAIIAIHRGDYDEMKPLGDGKLG